MKLHPSIVISTRDKSSVYVNGVLQLFRVSEDEAFDYASTVSDAMWNVDIKEPDKLRATPRDSEWMW